ncbi:hypothetical protein [Rhodococcus rhodochrous]|uniref:hypothetical protein n=1 Tax=Rhodococcus rhodochrous TaxID=1829 RepID=UPI001C97D3A2|nr:hypothetical protein [Rhodococcus rhodochrous]
MSPTWKKRSLSPSENRSHDERDVVESTPRMPWPQSLRITTLVLAIALLTAACASLGFALDTFRTGHAWITVGAIGGSLAVAVIAISTLRSAGFRNLRTPRSITVQHDPEHGVVLTIFTNRTTMWTTVVAMLGLVAYGSAAAFVWHSGLGEALLPINRDNSESALFIAVCAASMGLIAILIVSIRFETTLYICQRGVRRHVRRRVFFKKQVFDIFLSWEGITRIGVGNLGVGGGTTVHPVIDLHTAEPITPEARTRHDSEYRVAVMAHQLVTEPNTLFALLERLAENPHDRELLTKSDAVDLLRPPPLRERFRAARQPTRQHGNSR